MARFVRVWNYSSSDEDWCTFPRRGVPGQFETSVVSETYTLCLVGRGSGSYNDYE